MRIGITVSIAGPQDSVWTNGIKQNAIFLAQTLRHVDFVESVVLVDLANPPLPLTELPWDPTRWPTLSFGDAKDTLDVLIELGAQVSAAQTEYLKQRGCRLVSCCCGAEYVMVTQAILFGRPLGGANLFVNQRYDALWVIPQVAETSLHFFQTLRRIEATVVPFVWDPVFLEESTAHLPGAGCYAPHPGGKRVSIIEPNIDVLKFCLYPILIAEEAYRAAPRSISYVHATNAESLAQRSGEFIALMHQLDLVRDGKISFVKRFETPVFLAAMTDIVVSHQWGNPLNYLYLEVCWQGYPLVHNAHLCRDLGYYYPDHDVQSGREQLLRAVADHDAQAQAFLRSQRRAISRFLPDAPENSRRYGELLRSLAEQPLR